MIAAAPRLPLILLLAGYWGAAVLSTPGLTVDVALRYALFDIGWVVLPGAALLGWLGIPLRGAIWWPMSWAVGAAIFIGAVMVCGATQSYWWLRLAPVVALAALWHHRTARATAIAGLFRASLPLAWVLVAAAVLAGFLAVKGTVVLPLGAAPYSYINQDVLWNMGTVLAIERGFPPEDFQAAGMPFGYHFFQNAWLAGAHQVTDIPLETLVMRAHPLGLILTLTLGVYACARRLGLGRGAATLVAALQVLFVRGEFNSLISAIFYETGGFAFSLAGLVGVWLLAPWALRSRQTLVRSSLPLLLAAAGAAGAKIAGLPLLVAALGVGALPALRHPGLRLRVIGLGAVLAAATALAYVTTLSGIRSGGQMDLFPFYTLREQRWAEFAWAHGYPLPVVAALYLVWQYWPVAALGWLGLDRPTAPRGRVLRLTAWAFVLGGIAGSATFGHVGSSHLYFEYLGMLAVPFLVASVRIDPRRRWVRLGWALTVVGLAVVGLQAWHEMRAATLSWQGTRNTPEATFADDSVSRPQLEALAYLRTQTPRDAVVMANRRLTWPGYYRYYYNTAISERRAFLAGADYSPYGNLSRLYNRLGVPPERTPYYDAMEQRVNDTHYFFAATDATDARTRLCRHPLITHVLLDLQVQPGLAFPVDGLLTERFRNDHAVVYDVTGCGGPR